MIFRESLKTKAESKTQLHKIDFLSSKGDCFSEKSEQAVPRNDETS